MKKEIMYDGENLVMKITYLPLEPIALSSFEPVEIKSSGLKKVKLKHQIKSHVVC